LPGVIRSHGWTQLAPFHEDELIGGFSCIVHPESEKIIELRVQSGSGGIIVTIMVSNEWYAGAPVGRAEVEAAFERWGQWQGLAYWLWDWSW